MSPTLIHQLSASRALAIFSNHRWAQQKASVVVYSFRAWFTRPDSSFRNSNRGKTPQKVSDLE